MVITGGSDGFVRMWGLDYVYNESPDSTTSKASSQYDIFKMQRSTMILVTLWSNYFRFLIPLSLHRAIMVRSTLFHGLTTHPSIYLLNNIIVLLGELSTNIPLSFQTPQSLRVWKGTQ